MRLRKSEVPQPISPTRSVTLFSWIFSTILLFNAATGKTPNPDISDDDNFDNDDDDEVREDDVIIAGEFESPKKEESSDELNDDREKGKKRWKWSVWSSHIDIMRILCVLSLY